MLGESEGKWRELDTWEHVSNTLSQVKLPCDESIVLDARRNSSIDVVALHNCFDGLLINFLLWLAGCSFFASKFWGEG